MVDGKSDYEKLEELTRSRVNAAPGCMTVLFFCCLGMFVVPMIGLLVLSIENPPSGGGGGGPYYNIFPPISVVVMVGGGLVGGLIGSVVGVIVYRLGW